jgi:hypothetical protein
MSISVIWGALADTWIMTARHHTVPQFYLRRWANESLQVMQVDRDDPRRSFLSAVRKACAEVGFYRIETEDLERDEDKQGHDPEVVERLLGAFERSAAPAIYRMLNTPAAVAPTIAKEDWYHLINFIAVQTVRGQRWRDDLSALATHAMRKHLEQVVTDEKIEEWLIERGEAHDRHAVLTFRREAFGDKGPRLVVPQAVLVQESLKMAIWTVADRLADRMRWSLIQSRSVAVLTSDEPVCWWAPGDGPVGYGTAQVVWMPLGRHAILQLTAADARSGDLGLPAAETPDGADELARIVNREVAGQATRWIVHHPDDRPLDGLVLPARTRWADELVEVRREGSLVRERYVHRRLPTRDDEAPGTD